MPKVTKQTKRSVVKALVLAEILYAIAAVVLTLHVFISPALAYDRKDLWFALTMRPTVQELQDAVDEITVPDQFCLPEGYKQRAEHLRNLRRYRGLAQEYLYRVDPIYQEFVVRGNTPYGADFGQDIDELKDLWSKIGHIRDIADNKVSEVKNTLVVDCEPSINTQTNRTPTPKEHPTESRESQAGIDDPDEHMKRFVAQLEFNSETIPEISYEPVTIPEISEDHFCSKLEKIQKATSPVADQRRNAASNWTSAAAHASAARRALKIATVATDRQQLEDWLETAEQQEAHWRALTDELDILYEEVKKIPVIRCWDKQSPLPPMSQSSPNGNSSESDTTSDDMGLDIPRPTYESVDIPRIPESALCDERLKDQLIYTAEQAVRAAWANDSLAVSWLAKLRHALDNNLGNRPAVQRVRREAIADIDHWKEVTTKARAAVAAAKAIQVIDCEQKLSDLQMPSAPQQDQRSTGDDSNQQKYLGALQNMLNRPKPKERPAPSSFAQSFFQTKWDLSNSSQIKMIDSRSRMQSAADAFFGSNSTDVGSAPGGTSSPRPNNNLNFPQAAPSGSQKFRLTPTDSGTQSKDGIAPITTGTIDLDNQPFKPNRSQGFQNGNNTVNSNRINLDNQLQGSVGKTGMPQSSNTGMTLAQPAPLQFIPGTAIRGTRVIPPAQSRQQGTSTAQ